MSYCRWSEESDLYCYGTDAGYVTETKAGEEYLDVDIWDFIRRLNLLSMSGHKVPPYAALQAQDDWRRGCDLLADKGPHAPSP